MWTIIKKTSELDDKCLFRHILPRFFFLCRTVIFQCWEKFRNEEALTAHYLSDRVPDKSMCIQEQQVLGQIPETMHALSDCLRVSSHPQVSFFVHVPITARNISKLACEKFVKCAWKKRQRQISGIFISIFFRFFIGIDRNKFHVEHIKIQNHTQAFLFDQFSVLSFCKYTLDYVNDRHIAFLQNFPIVLQGK